MFRLNLAFLDLPLPLTGPLVVVGTSVGASVLGSSVGASFVGASFVGASVVGASVVGAVVRFSCFITMSP